METSEEQYITYSLSSVHDIEESIISHEEICEPEESESKVTTEILCVKNSSDDENSIVYPIYMKQEESQQHYTSGDDESMAVEALRQLGGMYPTFDDEKVVIKNDEIYGKSEVFNEKTLTTVKKTSKSLAKFACSTCGKKFKGVLDLNNHMVCHQVDRPHACRTCGNLFRSKSSLHTHMSQVHNQEKSHKCAFCGADFQRPSSLSNHMKIHTYVAGRALMSSQSSDNNSSVSSTCSVQTIENYQVAHVNWPGNYTFSSEEQSALGQEKLEIPELTVVTTNGDVSQFEYPYTYNISLNSLTNAESATLVKVENLPALDQARGEYVAVQLEEKSSVQNCQFVCTHCGVSFSKATSLVSHEKIHHAKSWTMPIECEYCDKQFQDSNHLASHQTTCTKKLMFNNSDNSNGGKWSKHACSECGKNFTTKQKMFRHQWIHRKKTHSCEVCGAQFEKQNELDEHRLAAHPGESPFTCSECGKSFVSRQGLWEHSRTHGGSPVHFQCDTCSKTFSSRQGYLIHHRTHTGERPYGCKFCWKAFRDGGTLRKHERIHTGERPHVCPLCSRAFNQKVVLREHVRWVHAAGKNETEVVGPPYPCPLCGALNQDRDELCAHIVNHSDQMLAVAKAKQNLDPLTVKSISKKKTAKVRPKSSRVKIDGQVLEKPGGETLVFVTANNGVDDDGTSETGKEQLVENINALRVQFIDERTNLEIISEDNEALPVLTIPDDTNEEFRGEIEKTVTEEGVTYQDSEDERELGLICGICGDEFPDKNVLMEHVKIHI